MREQNEQLFYEKLKDVFIGAKIEGVSGFINLMNIKSHYFDTVLKELETDIEQSTTDFPNFREEMFEKLFSFFKTYFSESGSVYFRYTPLNSRIYERAYTNQNDVALLWKTHMLYYVKTEKLWNNLIINYSLKDVESKIHFNVSKLEHKSDNQKRDILYLLNRVENNNIYFDVQYSKSGRKTKITTILRTLKKNRVSFDEENLFEVFRIFEKQNEVDYFINKDANSFLKEQFNIWLKNYLFDDESDFSEYRLKQLKTLKTIAFRVIDFIAQFEDELVKIWNKPKFVLNSNYVITLDRIASKNNGINVIEELLDHKGFEFQVNEWETLGFFPSFLKEDLIEDTIEGKKLSEKYKYLPIDTKYFGTHLVDQILSLFDNLDAELEGWLIHSENYQALKTILPKFENSVSSIYIDPPYNTDASAILYNNNYKDSSWLTLMENRLQLATSLLHPKGIICIAIDDEEFSLLNIMSRQIFAKQIGVAAVRSNPAGRKTKGKFAPAHEYALFYGKTEYAVPGSLPKTKKSLARYPHKDEKSRFAWANFIRSGNNDKREDRPKLFYPIFVDDKDNIRIPKLEWVELDRSYTLHEQPKQNETLVYPIVENDGVIIEKNWQRGYPRVENEPDEFRIRRNADGKISIDFKTRIDMKASPITWWDKKEYASANHGAAEIKALFGEKIFDYVKSLELVKDCLKASNLGRDETALDFFSGSGTTAHAVMALNAEDQGSRKYILVEMGDYFSSIIVPRVKKVAYSLSWKNGKVQTHDGKGTFCKYYDLEQYESTLRKVVYQSSHPFSLIDNESIYNQYVFFKDPKLLDALTIDYKSNRTQIDFSKIYSNIDLAETLSNLMGKKIAKIHKNSVEFSDGELIYFDELDFNLVRPLIWW